VIDIQAEVPTVRASVLDIILSHTDATRWSLRQKVTQNVTSVVA